MTTAKHPRLENLLAAVVLNLGDEGEQALERAAGLTGRATQALLALDEFLDGAHVGKLADVLGLTHSGAVRLVSQLERHGLAVRGPGADRRRVQVALTDRGRRRAGAA
ncbi:MAG: MarR family transcriptional regulator, partial [Microlunatus sp.]|nr:MarR family transcriptional regulator [Microlunatus sp.]